MSHISVDLTQLYKTYFGDRYEIDTTFQNSYYNESRESTERVAPEFRKTNLGISFAKPVPFFENKFIFFPLRLWESDDVYLDIECAVMSVTNKKTIIKTPVSRRIGTVKEQYAIGDYVFTINGVLFNRLGNFPEYEVSQLKFIYQSNRTIEIHSAFAEIFLADLTTSGNERCPVVIESLEFPENRGKGINHVPFSIVCETDFAETLIYSKEYLQNNPARVLS